MGMSKDELSKIFERFNRSKLSEEKKISGTGLGLAICKNLVEMLGGQMWVTSQEGKGSCFSFEIPYLRLLDNSPPAKLNEMEEIYNWQDKIILVAEDDDNCFVYLNYILENAQATVIRARNGKEALEALAFHPTIDLVLMDIQMPVMNGLDATIRIKEQFPNLPVIAQTAFAMQGDREKCLAAGCDDYITKPLKIDTVLAKIAQFINQLNTLNHFPKNEPLTNSKSANELRQQTPNIN
jgi:CheY-like chemotaxis protein